MIHQDIVILGAGPCGLGAAWQLQHKKVASFHVYEAAHHVGGLSSSITDKNGFTWDIGGHVFHTDSPRMQQVFDQLLGDNRISYKRHASVLIGTQMVPYPFQYSVQLLPEKIKQACIAGLEQTKNNTTATSFADWILQQFGTGMAKHFFFPYNKKLWRYPLSKMSWEWIDQRVAAAHDAHKGTAWGRNATFVVPRTGGIGEVWRAMGKAVGEHVTTDKRACAIDAKHHIVTFQDGVQVQYDTLLSTMPLPVLAGIMDVPLPSVSRLLSSGVYVVGIGMRGAIPAHLQDLHWLYVPSPHVPFFRMSVYSNYSEKNAPKGTWSLLFEVSYDKTAKLNREQCIREVLASAKAIQCIPEDAPIVDTFFIQAPYAYPVPTIGRDAVVSRIAERLAVYQIHTLGRFGLWKYEQGNMDHVCMRGMQWADAHS